MNEDLMKRRFRKIEKNINYIKDLKVKEEERVSCLKNFRGLKKAEIFP